ncbi:class I SAM-dependent methyltransferase [Candidatus Kapabacteria bacterium]|nr:class I SAM-dependent methyltransferase [Candidatus Kapabacteria bacterium]
MNRIELVEALIKQKNYNNYLEIGVKGGESFYPVVCKNKVAVDPNFAIPFYRKLIWTSKNPTNKNNILIEKTSDDFFEQDAPSIYKNTDLDISFVDGMHSFEAALLDVLNSLKYLSNGGIIVMHDCMPVHKAAETPIDDFINEKNMFKAMKKVIPGWTGEWNGDVWKAVYYLRVNHSDLLDSFVFDSDFGLGIVKPKSDGKLNLDINQESFNKIRKMTYDDLIKDPENIIGLTKPSKMNQYVKSL